MKTPHFMVEEINRTPWTYREIHGLQKAFLFIIKLNPQDSLVSDAGQV